MAVDINLDRIKGYALTIWPIRGDEYQLFTKRFGVELWSYCLTSPLFLVIPLYFFRAMWISNFVMGLVNFVFALLFLIPWLLVPTVVILAHNKTWPIRSGWGIYNLVFLVGWSIFFVHVLD